jgi:hypothetical protein
MGARDLTRRLQALIRWYPHLAGLNRAVSYPPAPTLSRRRPDRTHGRATNERWGGT